VVSPWSTGGWVCSEVFDHTSIVRLIEQRFGVHEPNISPWRRTVCGDLTAAFDFRKARPAVPALPDTAGYAPPDRDRHPDYVPQPPADPSLPEQEPGVRAARPLPYDLAADGRATGGELRIDFANRGRAGATFYVTSAPDDPRSYTVGAGRHLSGTWPVDGDTDVVVHGPNGFLRQFRGAGVDLVARHDADHEELDVALANRGSRSALLTVANAYEGGATTVIRIRPGQRSTLTVETRRHHGWYDISVTSDLDGRYLRRLAGHVETGEPSTSDPAM
jgi:phospholipase C